MGWEFDPHQTSYTTVNGLEADNVPAGSALGVFCRGRGCPFSAQTIHVAGRPRCSTQTGCGHAKPAGARSVDLTGLFRQRHLGAGSRIQISITQADTFGSAWTFKIRAGKQPTDQKTCLVPGSFTKAYNNC